MTKLLSKSLFLSLSSLILLNSITQYTLCDSIDDINSLIDPFAQEVEPPPGPLPGTGCISAFDILQLITPPPNSPICNPDQDVCPPSGCIINLPAILRENLYIKTTGPVTKRSLLDEPALRDYCLDHCLWHLTIHPFYNHTPRVYFTKNSPFIESYIKLANENVLNEVTNALEIAGCSDVDVPNILSLFRSIKLQQHRVGVMFGICRTFGSLTLSFRLPIYYLIEHFFLTDEEIEAIENATFFEDIGIASPGMTSREQAEAFGRRHLVSDRVGLGDARLNALIKIYETPLTDMWFGMQATIPTSKTIKSGLIGSKFNPNAPIPEFNIKELFELYVCPTTPAEIREAGNKINEIATNFLIGALDRLSTILFNAPLGNGRHFGVGPQVDIRHRINNLWTMHTFAAFEGFSRHEEDRFFLETKKPEDFDRNFRDEAQAEENLRFLNNQIINTLYPTHFKIGIRPGVIGKFAHSFIYDCGSWHGLAGFDYWYQGCEKIYVNNNIDKNFEIQKGTRPAAHQGKIFVNLGYRSITGWNNIFWDLAFVGDGTIFHKGIGANYTLGFRLTLDF